MSVIKVSMALIAAWFMGNSEYIRQQSEAACAIRDREKSAWPSPARHEGQGDAETDAADSREARTPENRRGGQLGETPKPPKRASGCKHMRQAEHATARQRQQTGAHAPAKAVAQRNTRPESGKRKAESGPMVTDCVSRSVGPFSGTFLPNPARH